MTADTQTLALHAELDDAERQLNNAEQRVADLRDELAAATGALNAAEALRDFAQDALYGSPDST